MALIRIICDGGGAWGFGNLRRSATLGHALAARGHRVRVEALSANAQALLPEVPSEPGKEDLLLLDLPYRDDSWVTNARVPVAALDYIGETTPDLTINIWRRETAGGNGRQVVGLEYAIIRPEIVACANTKGTEGVLVIIGGGDDTGLGEQVVLHLLSAGERAVTLIEGPLAVMRRPLPSTVRRLHSPLDLAERMAACCWAVTTGGTTMMEMMFLGKAVHIVPRTPFEKKLAQLLFDQGGLLGIGLDSLTLPTPALRATVGATAARLVDGHGVDRICGLMEDLL